MPSAEEIGIMYFFGLLMICYGIGLIVRFLLVNWYDTVLVLAGLIALRIWWHRQHSVYLDGEDDLEAVPQE